MNKSVCNKVVSMLFLYIENKLDREERAFVENHFMVCSDCYLKYLEMKEIIKNLHYEYQKLLSEFDKIEATKEFEKNEYEKFCTNISAYIDNELNYEDCIKFRKYIMNSKPARKELKKVYNLEKEIKNSVENFKDGLNINFSKNIIKKLQTENRQTVKYAYGRAVVLIGLMVGVLLVISLILGFGYINHSEEKVSSAGVSQQYEFPEEEYMVEFTFDNCEEGLLIDK